MSAPVLLSISAAAMALALPIVGAAAALDTAARVSNVADAAALAAADASLRWVQANPCDLARQVAEAAQSTVLQCVIEQARGVARVTVSATTLFGDVSARARAGPPGS